ncbi:monocarboxylate transporter 12-like [Acanthaster planci]|uniref:Monocarboxylate transporter 12-like n=1 Tax=Acanthaster planci TaxID=133434 RepID=A0A8B7YIM0_ACAPL|nr:monocarboxylate transporter 12-like [Acanthaster planci]XP_022093083.1 monocarboxylate transporter 12-like [Acanthaster planci]
MMVVQCSSGCAHAGWYAALCVHVDWLLWTGLLKSLGVMLPTLQEQFTADTWMIGGLIATITAVGSFAGLLSKLLDVLFGTRFVVTVCGFLLGASVIISSFSTSAFQITLVLCLIAGPGLVIPSILSRAMTGRYFTTNYATVNGIATTGDSLGLIFAPLTQVLLDTYGWRGALLLLGAISMHLGVCGFLLGPQPPSAVAQDDYLLINSSEEEQPKPNIYDNKTKSPLRILKDAVKAQRDLLGCTVCGHAAFWIVAHVYVVHTFVATLWLIYFVPYAESKGFSGYEAVTFTTAAAIANLVSRILVASMVDRGWLKLRLTLLISMITCGIALFTLPWVHSYWLMIGNTVISHSCFGARASLYDIYTRELVGAEELVSAFSWMDLLVAIIQIALGFLPGWIFDQTGSYDTAFIILGLISLLPLVSLLVENVINQRKS